MEKLMAHKGKIIAGVVIVAVLAFLFWWGGDAPGLQGWSVGDNAAGVQDDVQAGADDQGQTDAQGGTADTAGEADLPADGEAEDPNVVADDEPADDEPAQEPVDEPADVQQPDEKPVVSDERPGGSEGGWSAAEKEAAAAALAGVTGPAEQGDAEYSQENGMEINPETGKDKYLTDPVPEGKPLPVEPQDAVISSTAHTCTISVSCATILDNMAWLTPGKEELVPEDGWILQPTTVTFYEGESVFNVLLRTMKQNKIHMEYCDTPMYNSAYIEGINNLYEFDCGELSGWMYEVNGWFPNYGCSRYQVADGDVINWVFTCNLGIDVGGYSAVGGE